MSLLSVYVCVCLASYCKNILACGDSFTHSLLLNGVLNVCLCEMM